jgi:hypothetical protein
VRLEEEREPMVLATGLLQRDSRSTKTERPWVGREAAYSDPFTEDFAFESFDEHSDFVDSLDIDAWLDRDRRSCCPQRWNENVEQLSSAVWTLVDSA